MAIYTSTHTGLEIDTAIDAVDDLVGQVQIVIAAAGYQIVGDFADVTKVEIAIENQVYSSKSILGYESALWRPIVALPYTPTGTDPTPGGDEAGNWVAVSVGELETIARSLNTNNNNVMYDTDEVTPIVGYIYSKSQQVIYSVPAAAIGKIISSVVVSTLNTTEPASYQLIKDKTSLTIDTVSDIANLPNIAGAKVTWLGYNSVSDGGGNWGIMKSGAHTADGGSIFSVNGSNYIEANFKGGEISIMKFGATTARTDNDVPINALLSKFGNAYVPSGIFTISDGLVFNDGSKIHGSLNGSVIKTGDSANYPAINIFDNDGIEVANLEIDGNYSNQTLLVHGIRVNNSKNIVLDNLYIHDCFHYGIGAQNADNGIDFIENMRISNVKIERTGGDSFDMKDYEKLSSGVILENVTCIDWGLDLAFGATAEQAGIDIRCQNAVLNNITCIQTALSGTTIAASGVRVRESFVGDVEGSKGVKLSNITVKGVYFSGAHGVLLRGKKIKAVNVTVDGNFLAGVSMQHSYQSMINGSVLGAVDGIELNRYVSEDILGQKITGCDIDGISGDGIAISDFIKDAIITGNTFGAVGTEISVNAAASQGIIVTGNNFIGGSPVITDAGENCVITNNVGYRTSINILVSGLAVDSLGRVAGTLNHLLSSGSAYGGLRKVALTFTRETNVTDYKVSSLRTTAMDANIINFEFQVDQASGTAGAKIGVNVQILD